VDPENPGSTHVLEKLGRSFVREGELSFLVSLPDSTT
jgi:RimJ/RimL family protein N-acetyltransferase